MERERWNDAYCVKRWRKEGNLGEYGQMEDGLSLLSPVQFCLCIPEAV